MEYISVLIIGLLIYYGHKYYKYLIAKKLPSEKMPVWYYHYSRAHQPEKGLIVKHLFEHIFAMAREDEIAFKPAELHKLSEHLKYESNYVLVETMDSMISYGMPLLDEEFGPEFLVECSSRMVGVMLLASSVYGYRNGSNARRYMENYRARHFGVK